MLCEAHVQRDESPELRRVPNELCFQLCILLRARNPQDYAFRRTSRRRRPEEAWFRSRRAHLQANFAQRHAFLAWDAGWQASVANIVWSKEVAPRLYASHLSSTGHSPALSEELAMAVLSLAAATTCQEWHVQAQQASLGHHRSVTAPSRGCAAPHACGPRADESLASCSPAISAAARCTTKNVSTFSRQERKLVASKVPEGTVKARLEEPWSEYVPARASVRQQPGSASRGASSRRERRARAARRSPPSWQRRSLQDCDPRIRARGPGARRARESTMGRREPQTSKTRSRKPGRLPVRLSTRSRAPLTPLPVALVLSLGSPKGGGGCVRSAALSRSSPRAGAA